MPATYDIYPEHNLAIATLSGHLTVPEIVRNNMLYEADPCKSKGQATLINTAEVSDFRVSFGGLLAVAKYYLSLRDPFDPTILTAIHAPSDLMFGKASLYQRFVSNSEANCVGVFRTQPDCWRFLGIDPADINPVPRTKGLLGQ
ncbi:MAG: hypothetical protein MK098_13955 [Marinovum sp.]|nr:hypothetical protein [Marinovum sp.]